MIRSNSQPLGLVLIAGAGGFIGRRLVMLLRRSGIPGCAVDSRDADLRIAADARVLLEAHSPEVIVNLARPGHAGDSADHAGNVEIARNLLKGARHAGVSRLIQLGSSTEFGLARSPVHDDAALRPTTPFGRAKAEASSLVLAADAHGLRTAVLRPFSVYGPGDLRRHLIPAAIDAALTGRRLPLARGIRRDWVYVDDVALGCALALDGRADGLGVNLASGATVTNERVVDLVGELAGRRIDLDPEPIPPRPWDAGIAGVTERARSVLGWHPRTGLADGIRLTLEAAGVRGRQVRAAGTR